MSVSVPKVAALVAWFACHLQLAGAEIHQSEGLRRFDAIPGSRISVVGHQNIHEWKVEGTLISGFVEVAPGFPPQAPNRGDIMARAAVFIPVRNLRAVGESWEPYNEQRTVTIHRMLQAEAHPKILFRLTGLSAAAASRAGGAPYEFASTGELVIAGVTNSIAMPIKVTVVGDSSLKLSGMTNLKQSDFKIIPKPTGFNCFGGDSDTVSIALEWLVKEKRKR